MKKNSEVVKVERLRRITGYLVSDVRSFNNAKFAEVKDRTKNCGRIGVQTDKDLKRFV